MRLSWFIISDKQRAIKKRKFPGYHTDNNVYFPSGLGVNFMVCKPQGYELWWRKMYYLSPGGVLGGESRHPMGLM